VVAALASTPLTVEEVRAGARLQLDALKAELDVAKAEQASRISVSSVLPQVNLSLGVTGKYTAPQFGTQTVFDTTKGNFSQQTGFSDPFSVGNLSLNLTVTQLLYDGGKWWNQIAQSGAQETAAKGQFQEQQLASELEAVRRFYELLKAQVSLQVLEATVTRSRQQADRAQALYEAGRGPRSGVFDALTNVGNDEINVVRQRQKIVQARLALLQWLARGDQDVEAIPPAGLNSPVTLPELALALEQARTSRPLIRALAETTRAADLGVAIGWSNHLPQVSLNGGYSRNSLTSKPDLFVDSARQFVVSGGATLSLNLFSGFLYDAQLKQAQVELTRAQASQRQQLLDLEAELRRTHDAARVEREVLGLSERQLQVAEEQLRLEEERFSAGAGSTLEVRNAQVKFTQAQLAVLTGRADVAVARAALERTVGGVVP
jgi:outer membrane protein TolC